ncbi:MAG: helix-turn-helix transcriptional regulator [Bacteroidales bacterium]|nr:helix-turn-helix transcriptional regulator [Bacteroidales bacterium]
MIHFSGLFLCISLPLIVTLIGFVTLSLNPRKNATVRILMALAVACSLYYLCETQSNYKYASVQALVWAQQAVIFIAPMTLAFINCFLYRLYYEQAQPWYHYLWFVIPIVLCTSTLLLQYLIGADELIRYQSLTDELRHPPYELHAQPLFRAYHLFSYVLYKLTLAIYAIWEFTFLFMALRRSGFSLHAYRNFLFHRGTLPPIHILSICIGALLITVGIKVGVGRYFLLDHDWACIVISLLEAFLVWHIVLTSSCTEYSECTFKQFVGLEPKEDLTQIEASERAEKEEEAAEIAATSRVGEPTYIELPETTKHQIATNLHMLMDEKQIFLQSGLKVEDVARQIGTNRYYLSRYINDTYHINFNDYLNQQRIEFAKSYMLEHTDVMLDEIAVACGFISAQAFGRKFKEIVGVPPRTWMSKKNY